jgi:CRISPR-associated protein Csy1
VADPRVADVQARLAAGDASGARTLADAMLADSSLGMPDRFGALVLRSRAHEAQGDLPNAIVDLEGALAIDATQARIWNELGFLSADAGMNERAITAFEHATRSDPGYARAWNNLGNALRAAGRGADAVQASERAVAADPNYALGWSNLGALKRDTGDDSGAEIALRRALTLEPNQRGALVTLAGLLRDRSDLAAAGELFARARELDPRDATAALLLAGTLAERDDLAGARAAYAQAEASDPRMLRALFGRWLTLPMVPADATAVAQARAAFSDGLSMLEREAPLRAATLSAERALDEMRWSNFLLAYQGEDDKPLQARYAGVVREVVKARAPDWLRPLSPRVRAGSRTKVGFLSTFLRDSTAGRYFESWIADLPRGDFEVFLYHLLPGIDPLARRLTERADHLRHCPGWRPSQLAPRVRADTLDVLVYPELGMGAVPFALAALRLAPLQCAGWGHPVTTGHPTIDVFFSSAAMEPPDGASHYTERLVTLPGIGTRYHAPQMPADATRERMGLPPRGPLLLCPQSLFKIHPDNDALFARLLRELPQASLVCFEGRDPQLSTQYQSRLAKAGIAADRVRIVSQCAHDDFLRINTMCDVMVDTLHWSGGNTSLDALACALPIVTLPGRFMRGRQSAGMLRLMGIDELVARDADDYVQIVARLVGDSGWRDAISARIRDGQARVFDDPAPTAAIAEFLRR